MCAEKHSQGGHPCPWDRAAPDADTAGLCSMLLTYPDHKMLVLDPWAKGPQLLFSKFLRENLEKQREVVGKAG